MRNIINDIRHIKECTYVYSRLNEMNMICVNDHIVKVVGSSAHSVVVKEIHTGLAVNDKGVLIDALYVSDDTWEVLDIDLHENP